MTSLQLDDVHFDVTSFSWVLVQLMALSNKPKLLTKGRLSRTPSKNSRDSLRVIPVKALTLLASEMCRRTPPTYWTDPTAMPPNLAGACLAESSAAVPVSRIDRDRVIRRRSSSVSSLFSIYLSCWDGGAMAAARIMFALMRI